MTNPVELLDVGPTLADAARAEIAYPQWGRSLLPLLRGECDAVRSFAVCEDRGEIMLVDERWKVALNRAGDPYLSVELETDPGETSNLAGTEAARAAEQESRGRALSTLLGTQLFDEWH